MDNLVFAKENGEYLYPKISYRRVMRVLKKAELEEFNIKSFRHTNATFMLQNNIHPRVVQERLGHSNIEITLNIYSHMVPSMQKEASEKLENFLND